MSKLSVDELLAQATCAVLINGEIAGTAWLVSQEGHLLTAGHILGISNPLSQVEVKFTNDIPQIAHRIQWGFQQEIGLDFAVLKLTKMPMSRQPLPISLTKSVKLGSSLRLRGCGRTFGDPITGEGKFKAQVDRQGSSSNRLFRYHTQELAEEGFSGGAVYCEQLGAVVAIQIEATNARFGNMSGMVLAMPLYRVAQLWELLKDFAIGLSQPRPEHGFLVSNTGNSNLISSKPPIQRLPTISDPLTIAVQLIARDKHLEVRATTSSGEGKAETLLPPLAILNELAKHKPTSIPHSTLQEIGQTLYQCLMAGDVGELVSDVVQGPARQAVQVQLRFDADQISLARYPWEMLANERGKFLVHDGDIEVTRYINYPQPLPAFNLAQQEMSLLRVISQPASLSPITAAELAGQRFPALQQATFERFWRKLLIERMSLWGLQFAGHGALIRQCLTCGHMNSLHAHNCRNCKTSISEAPPIGALAFERDGDVEWRTAKEVGEILYNAKIQLALISACENTITKGRLIFNALAPGLILGGVPAVIGMQLPTSYDFASLFFNNFYTSLLNTSNILMALRVARRSLSASAWYSPVLYMRNQKRIEADKQITSTTYKNRQIDTAVPAKVQAGTDFLVRLWLRRPQSKPLTQEQLRSELAVPESVPIRTQEASTDVKFEPIEGRKFRRGEVEVKLNAIHCDITRQSIKLFVDEHLDAPPAIFAVRAKRGGHASLIFSVWQDGGQVASITHHIEVLESYHKLVTKVNRSSHFLPAVQIDWHATDNLPICSTCDTVQKRATARFCRKCGSSLAKATPLQATPQADNNTRSVSSNLPPCSTCGTTQRRAAARFCRKCGSSVVTVTVSSNLPPCSNCGTTQKRATARFCAQCGSSVVTVTPQQATPQPVVAPAPSVLPIPTVPDNLPTCPTCGSLQRYAGKPFCDDCGSLLSGYSSPVSSQAACAPYPYEPSPSTSYEPSEQASLLEPVSSTLPTCSTCETVQRRPNAKFCAKCGSSLTTVTTKEASDTTVDPNVRACPTCGVVHQLGEAFCGDCGSSLSTSPPSASYQQPAAAVQPYQQPAAAQSYQQPAAAQSYQQPAPIKKESHSTADPNLVTCPTCGVVEQYGAPFCGDCGSLLAQSAAPPPQAVVPPLPAASPAYRFPSLPASSSSDDLALTEPLSNDLKKNNLSLDELLAQATCAVLINGEIAGTAWLASQEGHLLTAGHVLYKDSNACDEVHDKVEVQFSDDEPRIARIIEHDFKQEKGIDFAVLKLTDMPANRHPLQISLEGSVSGTFRLYGYGKSLKGQTAGEGKFVGTHGSKANRLFRLRSKELAEEGFSGGAVYSTELGAVVAIQIEAGKARIGPTSETVLAMPLYRIAEYWTPLQKINSLPPEVFNNPKMLLGKTVASYKLLELLGSGGSGVVFRALHNKLGKEVALKVFHPLPPSLSNYYELFDRAYEALGALKHQNIVDIFDCGQAHIAHSNIFWLCMEYVKGNELDVWSKQLNRDIQALNKRLNVALQLARALQTAHETTYIDQIGIEKRGVLHGDLKPANIIVTESQEVKILDFLLVDIQQLLSPYIYTRISKKSKCTMAFGTPDFMAPEQAMAGLITVKTDIYGLGVTFFHLFLPERSYHPVQYLRIIDNELPSSLNELLYQMTSDIPSDRPKNMQEVTIRLQEILKPYNHKPSAFQKFKTWLDKF